MATAAKKASAAPAKKAAAKPAAADSAKTAPTEGEVDEANPDKERVDRVLDEMGVTGAGPHADALAVMPDETLETKRTPEVIESQLDVPNRKSPLPTLPENHAFASAAAVRNANTSQVTGDEQRQAERIAAQESINEQQAHAADK